MFVLIVLFVDAVVAGWKSHFVAICIIESLADDIANAVIRLLSDSIYNANLYQILSHHPYKADNHLYHPIS